MTEPIIQILLADDDPSLRLVLSEALSHAGYKVETANTMAECLNKVTDPDTSVLVCDVMFPDGNSLDQMESIRTLRPDLAIIVMSAQATLLTAVKAREHAVDAYLPKPFPLDELTQNIGHLLTRAKGAQDTESLNLDHDDKAQKAQMETRSEASPIIGKSRAMQDIYRSIARLMATDLTVMITGESGSGKEVVAKAIHDLGGRSKKPFVALNMAAIPHDLIESELFGYEKGAFTGADKQTQGRFDQAAGGTLFLDEIGDMPTETQTRLLRVLQDGYFTRVGGRESIRANTRIIAATHKNLDAEIENGAFRQDLFYRLNVVPISVPPLRERAEDIPDLINHIMEKSLSEGLQIKSVSASALNMMMRYPWPGNVRELENMVRRLLVLIDDDEIDDHHLDDMARFLADPINKTPNDADHDGDGMAQPHNLSQCIIDHIGRYFEAHEGDLPTHGIYDRIIAEVEKPLITTTLAVTRGNQLKAAEVLGINRNTLRKKIITLGIDPKSNRVRQDF
ncbi:MAG: nitrogen regulation protein NR(I) [Candidatus Puniceispirillum sp. TMED52]|nr:nitrogen regulation protein NR(I) [SAR116 cluster bacterium]OUU42780.1 MAG: nitrogen regulation protein NR(I) [Candidatus Puniceispirillum sp. TMED52]HCP18761.1 nitrogen regulation protein NR(I) [Alphaproteobacteria bacterium]